MKKQRETSLAKHTLISLLLIANGRSNTGSQKTREALGLLVIMKELQQLGTYEPKMPAVHMSMLRFLSYTEDSARD